MRRISLLIIVGALITLGSCQNEEIGSMTKRIEGLEAPIAAKKDSIITTHGHDRVDPYFWMRLTDDQKNAEQPDEHTQEVLD